MLKKHDTINPRDVKTSSRIFVCSTFEIFHPLVPKYYRDFIFDTIESNPQHTFQILTKFPQNIEREMPDNVWLGVSITGLPDEEQFNRGFDLFMQEVNIKFISFEPLLYPINESLLDNLRGFDWIIIGRLTGYGRKHDPEKFWIEEIIESAKEHNIPIFLKDNLKPIWGESLIQEFPE